MKTNLRSFNRPALIKTVVKRGDKISDEITFEMDTDWDRDRGFLKIRCDLYKRQNAHLKKENDVYLGGISVYGKELMVDEMPSSLFTGITLNRAFWLARKTDDGIHRVIEDIISKGIARASELDVAAKLHGHADRSQLELKLRLRFKKNFFTGQVKWDSHQALRILARSTPT